MVVSKNVSLRENAAPVDCCGLNPPSWCNVVGYPTFCEAHFDSKCTFSALKWENVVEQLKKQPFAFVWRYAAVAGDIRPEINT